MNSKLSLCLLLPGLGLKVVYPLYWCGGVTGLTRGLGTGKQLTNTNR